MTDSTSSAVPSTYATDELVAIFAERATLVGTRVERAPSNEAAAAFIVDLVRELEAPRPIVATELTARAPGLTAALAAAGVRVMAPGEPSTTRDAPLGISLTRCAVAETASVLLAEPTLEDRAIGLLAVAQLIVCQTNALVPSLADAAEALRAVATRSGSTYATLVSSPSRTADIERALTVGVQGPARLLVLFVDDLT